MLRKLAVAAALACLAFPAFAKETKQVADRPLSLALEAPPAQHGLAAEVVTVETVRSPAAVIATDALYGGLAGLAIGGGIALINNGNNWERDLALGAGIGLLAGGVYGAVDAATMTGHYDRYASEGTPAMVGPKVGYGARF
jgi:hypothetical protein